MSSEAIRRGEWRAGWTLVLAAGLGCGAGTIHFHSVGVMIVPLEQAMGWSRSEISGGMLIASLSVGIVTFFAGAVADRIGARRVAITGLTLYALALIGIGFSGPTLLSWYAAWSFLALVQGMATAVIFAVAVVSRFSKHRGLALGITLSGSGLVITTVPPFALWLTETWGWSAAYFGLAALIYLIPLPFLLAFFRDAHDLARSKAVQKSAAAFEDARAGKKGLSIRVALTGRHAWRLAFSFLVLAIGVATFLVHLQPMLIGSGMSARTAAYIASVVGPSLIVGRLITGAVLDRLRTPIVAGIVAVFPAMCCLLMLNFNGSIAVAIVVAIMLGVATGSEGDVLSYIVAEYMGEKNYGALFSVIGGIVGLGFGVAPYIAGLIYDIFGSYTLMLNVNLFAALLASGILFTLPKPPEYA